MVATRRSLGGHPSPAASSPPAAAAAAATGQLSRAQQAALKKLNIAGTDALKGDTKAAQAAKEAVQTYHYRGAVYAADANTPSSWIENQPKRYLKRSKRSGSDAGDGGEGSIAVSEEREEDEDEEEEEEEEETRRPAKKKARHSMPHQGRNHKPISQTPTSSRGKARATRGGRQSLPVKRKAADIHDNNNDDDDDSSMNEFDYANSGGPDERVILPRLPNWLGESEPARRERLSNRVNAIPPTRSPIPNSTAINYDIQRRKQEAARKNYQVQALGEDDIMSEKDLARVALVKLAKKQRQLNEKMIEWRMAKELLEIKKKEAELKAAMPDIVETAPEQPNDQPPIDQTQSNKVNEDEIDEQWEREQAQNRARNKSKPHHDPSIAESSPTLDSEIPYLSNATYHPFTKPGASRPSTPKTLLTGANALPHSSKHGYTMPAAPATPTSGNSNNNNRPPTTTSPRHDVDFTTLPPNGPLPTYSAGGDPMKWTIQRRTGLDAVTGEERAEYAIDLARLEGESKSAKIRRVKRERAVVESWRAVEGGVVVERDGSVGAERD